MAELYRPDTALGFRHEVIGEDPACPYLERWVLGLGVCAIRLHHFFRSDEDHLHDHPWWFAGVVLKGSYVDETCEVPDESHWRTHRRETMRPGKFYFRPALHAHRVVTDGAWTLLITGRKSRDWGFYTPKGWMRQRRYFREYESTGKHACD